MSKPSLLPLESTRRCANPPVVADVMALCAGEETRLDYTFDARAMRAFDVRSVREIRARMKIRHMMYLAMRRAQYR
jgi:hypothetical protein